MRLFVSVIMRDVSTQGAVLDILRGVPRVFLDYLGYDEYAHRRGPDAELALFNLQGIDGAIAKIFRAARAVPEYDYDIFVFSDHGQLATTPFERVVGRELTEFVLDHARVTVGGSVRAHDVQELVSLRATEQWTRTLHKGLRGPARLYVEWLRRRLRRAADDKTWKPLDAIEVVTGGSIAHIYFDCGAPARTQLEEIDARYPELIDALEHCPAVGLMVARGQRRADGALSRAALSARRLARAVAARAVPPRSATSGSPRTSCTPPRGARYGDLVLYGAFAEAGDVVVRLRVRLARRHRRRRARSVHAAPGARRHARRAPRRRRRRRRAVLSLLRAAMRRRPPSAVRPPPTKKAAGGRR